MAPALTKAEIMRKHRLTFERAMRDNVSLDEAARRIGLEEIELRRRAIEAVRNGAPVQRPQPLPDSALRPRELDGNYPYRQQRTVAQLAEGEGRPWYRDGQYE